MSLKTYEGSCHCGAIGFTYRTAVPQHEWSIRACQCAFCRAHGALSTSDPNGTVDFQLTEPDQLVRYRFALRTADFLLCRSCGVYIGAIISAEKGTFAIVNLNTIQSLSNTPDAEPVRYDDEAVSQRVARREERWTPVIDGL